MAVKPIPEGYQSVIPALSIEGAAEAIEFYKRAFGAKERSRMLGPGNTIAHAEIEIGDSVVMVNDPFPQSSVRPPTELGGTSIGLFCYVEDVDATFKQAIDAGAESVMEVEDQFWGDRFGSVRDPYGHSWSLATHIEDVSPEEMEERSRQFMEAMASSS
jgi:PhnB protein